MRIGHIKEFMGIVDTMKKAKNCGMIVPRINGHPKEFVISTMIGCNYQL